QGGEELIFHKYISPTESIEQGAFTTIGIAYQSHYRNTALPAALAI
ncbi:unnamed protein product, partial [marine sediment metagenome]